MELLHGCACSEQACRAKCSPCQRGRRVKCTGVHFEMNTQISAEWANSSGRGNQFKLYKLLRSDHFVTTLFKSKILSRHSVNFNKIRTLIVEGGA